MQSYVAARSTPAAVDRQTRLLRRIIPHQNLHAQMLNALARLEYVAVRKRLKSRRAESLDLEGLQHILDETIHALRLKKACIALAADASAVRTFSDEDTLAGRAGEEYLQGVDDAAEAAISDLPQDARAEV